MKKLIYHTWLVFLAVLITSSLKSQDEKPINFWSNAQTTDFRTIQEATEGWFENRDKEQGTGYKQWKRWEVFNVDRLTPDGQITNHTARNYEALQQFRNGKQKQNERFAIDSWRKWGDNNYSLAAGVKCSFSRPRSQTQ